MIFAYGDKETAYLKAQDPQLGAVITHIGHLERQVDPDFFSSVVYHIIGQQISGKAQNTIWKRVQERYGTIQAQPIGRASPSELQSLGMSLRKAEAVKEFAEKVQSGAFDLAAVAEMDDRQAIQALSSLKGVGVWTAEMLLLFCLQRPDILSYGDFGIKKGMCLVYGYETMNRKLFAPIRERLSPYGSVASFYFWAVANTPALLPAPPDAPWQMTAAHQ